MKEQQRQRSHLAGTLTGSRAGREPKDPLEIFRRVATAKIRSVVRKGPQSWPRASIQSPRGKRNEKAREKAVRLWLTCLRLGARGDQPEPSSETCPPARPALRVLRVAAAAFRF